MLRIMVCLLRWRQLQPPPVTKGMLTALDLTLLTGLVGKPVPSCLLQQFTCHLPMTVSQHTRHDKWWEAGWGRVDWVWEGSGIGAACAVDILSRIWSCSKGPHRSAPVSAKSSLTKMRSLGLPSNHRTHWSPFWHHCISMLYWIGLDGKENKPGSAFCVTSRCNCDFCVISTCSLKRVYTSNKL